VLGRSYNRETLEGMHKDKNIVQVLDMPSFQQIGLRPFRKDP